MLLHRVSFYSSLEFILSWNLSHFASNEKGVGLYTVRHSIFSEFNHGIKGVSCTRMRHIHR